MYGSPEPPSVKKYSGYNNIFFIFFLGALNCHEEKKDFFFFLIFFLRAPGRSP